MPDPTFDYQLPEETYAAEFGELLADDEKRRGIDRWAREQVDNARLFGVDVSAGLNATQARLAVQSMLTRPFDSEYADDLNRYATALAQAQAEHDENRGVGTLARHLGGVARSATQAIPLAAGGTIGLIAGGAAQASNEAYTEGIDAGLSAEDALKYSLTTGAIEGVITAGLQSIGLGGLERGASSVLSKHIATGLAKAGIQLGVEVGEEVSIAVAQEVNRGLSGVDPNGPSWDSALRAAGDAAIQTLIQGGVGEVARAGLARADAASPSTQPAPAAEPLTPVEDTGARPAFVDLRTEQAAPTLNERITQEGILPAETISVQRQQQVLDDTVDILSELPELSQATLERHDNSIRIKYGTGARASEVVVTSPEESAAALAESPDQGWASMQAHGTSMTESQFRNLSKAKKIELLRDGTNASIVFQKGGRAVPLGTDSLIYLVEGRASDTSEGAAAVTEELAHRAFVMQITDSEVSTLRNLLQELGYARDYGATPRHSPNFQEDIAQVYQQVISGELNLDNTQTSQARGIFARIRRFFSRLLRLQQRLPPELSEARRGGQEIFRQLRGGELLAREDNLADLPAGQERILEGRIERQQAAARKEAAGRKKTARAQADLAAAERIPEVAQRQAAEERIRQEAVARRQDEEALRQLRVERQTQEEGDALEASLARREDREALRQLAVEQQLNRLATQERAAADRNDRVALRELRTEADTMTAEQALERSLATAADREALRQLAVDQQQARLATREQAASEQEGLRQARQARAEVNEGIAQQGTLRRAEEERLRSVALGRRALEERTRAEAAMRRLTEEQRKSDNALRNAREDAAKVRNRRLSAEEANRLRELTEDLNLAEEMLAENTDDASQQILRDTVAEIRRDLRAVRAESRAARAENVATASEGGLGPLAAVQARAPQPEVRAEQQRRLPGRETDTGRQNRLRAQGEFMLRRLGWRKVLDAVDAQAADLGGDYGRISKSMNAALSMAKLEIQSQRAKALRRGSANRWDKAMARVNEITDKAWGEAGARLNDVRNFHEESGPLERAEMVYREVTRPSGPQAREIARLRRQGKSAEADAKEADIAARNWERYESRLAEVGLRPEDILREDLDLANLTVFQIESTRGKFTLADKAGAVLGLATRASVFGPGSAARIFLLAPVLVASTTAIQMARGLAGDVAHAASFGMIPKGKFFTTEDFVRASVMGAAWMSAGPQATIETIMEGHSAAMKRLGFSHMDPLDPNQRINDAEILVPGSTTRRRAIRALLDINGRLMGAADQTMQMFMAGFHTYEGAVSYTRETKPELRPGTLEWNSEIARQMDPTTWDEGVRGYVRDSVLDATAARAFEGTTKGAAIPTTQLSAALGFFERQVNSGPRLARSFWQQLFVVFRTAIRGGEQAARHVPITSAVLLAHDALRANHPTATFTQRQRRTAQMYRTAIAHMLPFLIAPLLPEDEAEEIARGNISGVNARYLPLIGPLLESYGKVMSTDFTDMEAARAAVSGVTQTIVLDLVPARRLLGEGLSWRGDMLEQIKENSPAYRTLQKTAESLNMDDATVEERWRRFAEGIAPLRDIMLLFDDEFAEELNRGEAGVGAAIGLRPER